MSGKEAQAIQNSEPRSQDGVTHRDFSFLILRLDFLPYLAG